MAKQLRLDPAQLTDVGRKREHNEDNMAYVIPKDPQVMAMKGALFIVADGMGGHAAGEVASEIAVDTVSNAYYIDDNQDVPTPLLQAIKRANLAIHQRAAENLLRSGMGTTCVAAVLRGNMAYIANVGDSRAYMVRGNQVRQITQDHSWVAEQVRAGLLTEEQARTHAQRNVITRCLGTQPDVEVDVFLEPLQENDCLVLCTDGLSGLISDEEVMRIVDQSVPQESVYHLVERANENGGPDNITAIVVRVQEVGMEPPGARIASAVHVGGREISEENTSALNMLAGSPVSFAASNGDVRVSSTPLQFSSGPLASPDSITAPQPAVAMYRRSRLFFPTLFLIFLIVAALAGGGIFYFVHSNQNAAIAQTLDKAQQKIVTAKGEKDPTRALQDLSTAQSSLSALPKTQTLDGSQNGQLTTLQNQMVAQVKSSIEQYNSLNNIASLPCNLTNINPVNATDSNAQPQNVVVVQNGKGTGNSLFALGKDGSIYQIDNSFNLVASLPKPAASSYISIASGGSQLFTLSEQLQVQNGAQVPGGYTLTMYTLDQTGKLVQPINVTIDQTYTAGGFVPIATAFTAWGTNVYVVLANQNQGHIVKYAPDNKNHLVPASPFNFSISATISSVAAFSNQFFMLFSDGEVKSLPLTGAAINTSALFTPVLTTLVIPTPLSITSIGYTPSTPIPAVTPQSQNSNVPLNISTATMLASGVVNGAPHLYIGDPQNHRVLDLDIPAVSGTGPSTATGTSAQPSLTMQLVQQFFSPQLLNPVKSIAVDPQGANVNMLAQNASQLNLVTVSSGTQAGCASGA
ncbi:MAG: Stp1/IreP family PP2C-type Ser/Thr phosphatase [Ktedonobacteraceae bacterium]